MILEFFLFSKFFSYRNFQGILVSHFLKIVKIKVQRKLKTKILTEKYTLRSLLYQINVLFNTNNKC